MGMLYLERSLIDVRGQILTGVSASLFDERGKIFLN